MEELFKNSLLGQLSKMGFDVENSSNTVSAVQNDILDEPNPLSISIHGDIENSPFAEKNKNVDNPIKEKVEQTGEIFNDEAAQKRLNDLDLNILQDDAIKKAGDKFSGNNFFGKILYRYFPKIYKGFLIKKALNKLKGLNQTAADLVLKKIPYGESEERYDALSDYISNANTIHAKLMKKI